MTFHSVNSTHLGGIHVGRSVMRMIHDGQMERAYKSKDKGDFEEAAQTRKVMNLADLLMAMLRLGR